MYDSIRELIRNLVREPARLLGMLFGVVLGSCSIVFLGSALTTASEMLSQTSQQASGNDITQVRSDGAATASLGRAVPELSERDVPALANYARVAPDYATATTLLQGLSAQVGGRSKPVGFQSGGTTYAKIARLKLQHGRWLLPEEDGERLCLIGHDIFRELFGGVWPLADRGLVLQGATRLTVVGVFAPRPPLGGEGGGEGTWMYDRRIIVSSATFRHVARSGHETDAIVMRHQPEDGRPADLRAMATRLFPYLRNLHGGVANFNFIALEDDFQLDELIVSAVGAILYMCGLIAMLVGGINVMNAQLVAVSERTVEYGIRRALGLSRRRLTRSVLVESASYTLLGSLAGGLLGLGASLALSLLLTSLEIPWTFRISFGSLIAAVASALVIGVSAGYWPARRASLIEPSECLRST